MKIKSSFIKRHIAVLSVLLLLHPAAATEKAAPQKGAGDFTVISGRGIENESFSVSADCGNQQIFVGDITDSGHSVFVSPCFDDRENYFFHCGNLQMFFIRLSARGKGTTEKT